MGAMVTSAWVVEQGRSVGFDKVGVAPAADLEELALFPAWLERGYAGALDYLRNPKRRDARRLLPDARSVVCCALAYDTHHPRSTEVPLNPERGWISRYAWGDDYHAVLEEKLETLRARMAERAGPGFQAKLYVDTGPVLERVYGKHAGLGWQAKNTCLIDPELGSYFFLGVLVTNLELSPGDPLPDGCGACTLCIEACPTGALVEPYVLDARRCISYLTIELRDSIPVELRQPMGRHVFGCDICQDVCPWNAKSLVTNLPPFQPRALPNHASAPKPVPTPLALSEVEGRLSPAAPAAETLATTVRGDSITEKDSFLHPRLEWLASLTEEEFREVFRRSPVKRARWRGLLRNTLVAMGNSGNARFRPLLETFAASDDTLLAEHARWALARMEEAQHS